MTRPIDEKIVSMKMDNSDFKQKAAETTSLFGKLRDALNKIPGINLGQTTESLKDIGRETNNIDMNGLANNIQTVANRFTNLGIVATTALVNITNRAMNAGLALTKSLTVDPIMQGFDEYELKIGSIKTILSNTQWAGTSLDDVKRALGELNDYADQTIYSFSEMTSNIGRFTAAGVKLDDSTIAIKGLSNLAAASGSNVEQLNSAMYQMSQAMAAGKMNLMDWNSLVNAGMGGKKLQDSLLETAKAMGKQVDMTDGFRSSIEQGWLTSEVFLTTLKKFGNDQSMIEAATKVRTFSQLMDTLKESIGSGWATTFELIIGDFEEATNLWSKVAESLTKSVGQSADERNKLLESIADKGGFQNIFEGIENASKPVVQVFKAIGDGFEKAFPPASVDRIVQMTNSFKEFTAGLSLSDDRVQQLTTIFHGLFAIFSTVWEIAKRLTSAFVNLIPPSAGVGILSLLEKLAEMSISFNESVKAGNVLTKTIDGLGVILGGIGRVVGELTGYIFGFGLSLKTGIGGAVDWITKKIAPVGQNLKDAFGGFGGDEILGAGTLVGMGLVIQKIFGFFSNANRIVNSVKEVFEGIGDAVKNFAMGIQINNLLRIAIALGILAASLKVLEGIDAKDLANGITALATSLGVMIGGMTLINKLQVTGGIRASVTLIALATAVSIMAGALKKISDLNTGDLIRGMVGLVAVTASLSAAIIAISKLGGKINTGSIQLIALAGAVYILAGAVSKMSGIDTGGLLKSVLTLGVIFAELAAFIKMVNGAKLGMGSALGLIAVSGAITLIVGAIQKIAVIDVGGLTKGLVTIGIILTEMTAFSKLVGGLNLFAAGAGLILMGVGIQALVGPIQSFGNMSLEQLAKGLGAMAVALLAIAGASMLMTGGIAGIAGVLAMAIALNAIAIPIQMFAVMTWENLLKGFVGLAGTLALLAGASLLLTPAVPSMLAFGVALLALGAGMALAGAGVGLFAAGLTALATLTATSVAAIISALALLIQGLTSVIGGAVDFVVKLGIALIDGIGQLVPKLVDTVADLIIHILETISERLPEFIVLGADIIVKLMDGIGEQAPRIIDAAMNLMVNVINGMTEAVRNNGTNIVTAVIGFMDEVLATIVKSGLEVVKGVLGWIPGVKEATESLGENFSKGFMNGIDAMIGKVVDTASRLASSAASAVKKFLNIKSPSRVTHQLGEYFGEGLANGILNKTRTVTQSAKGLAITAKDSLSKFLDGFESLDNELRIKLMVDYDSIDTNKLGNIRPITMKPDTSLTNRLTTSVASNIRQNDNKNLMNKESKINKEVGNNNGLTKQPLIIQSVLNGRVIAEETLSDISELLSNQTNLNYSMRGV